MHYTAKFRTHPPPQAAGTVYFALDVDDVPAASGSRAARRLRAGRSVAQCRCAADGGTVGGSRQDH